MGSRSGLVVRIAIALLVISAGSAASHAQSSSGSNVPVVSTFLTNSGLNGPDGFALDDQENLFIANWGGGVGTTVLKVTSAAVVTVFDSSSSAPDGLAFDSSGDLYISNYSSGIITRVTPGGIKTVFASGFSHPSALAFDAAGNLYVSNHTGGTVSRIAPDGTASTFASGFNAPLGLVFDPQGNLYVSNYNSGVVNKVDPAGAVTVFATVPNPITSRIQYLARSSAGNLFLPSYGHHKIYKISPAGVVSVFAGTGQRGHVDGPVDVARFNGPNSIAITRDGDMYVSEYNPSRVRKITGVDLSDASPSALAGATIRNGSGVNPDIYTSTSLPSLGTNWTSEVRAGAAGAGGVVFVFGYSDPLAGTPTAFGELLLDPASSWLFTSIATAGGAGTSSHTVAVPVDPLFSGGRCHAQAYLGNVAPSGQLTNAIDLVFGF